MPGKSFEKLVEIVAKLRGPDGCPWDREQTHESLKPYLLEEAYEVLETVDAADHTALREELGDLLLQSVFHAQIAAENHRFTINDVLEGISEKLVRRHPHVFGDVNIQTAAEQTVHWEKVKKAEGKQSAIDGVPAQAPALLRAYRMQQKASTVGFDWDHAEPVWGKVYEELDELKRELAAENTEAVREEFGDLLFALVNLSRFIHVHPEEALRRATDKFARRFQQVEADFQSRNQSMRDASLEELDAVWERIKKKSGTSASAE